MARLLLNTATVHYDGNKVDSCEVVALIDNKLKIYKTAINYEDIIQHHLIPDSNIYVYTDGDNIYYQIIITNYNSKDATSIKIIDTLNKGLTYNSDVALFIDGTPITPAPIVNITHETLYSGEILKFSIPDIPTGKDALLSFSVKQSTTAGLPVDTIASNSALISYSYNNDTVVRTSETNTVYVKYKKKPPLFKVTKDTINDSVLCNKQFYYTITIKNEGGATDSPISITDKWYGNFTIDSPLTDQISINIDTTPVTVVTDYTASLDTSNSKLTITFAPSIILESNQTMTIKIKMYVPCDSV